MKTCFKFLTAMCLALWATALSAQTHWSFDHRQYQYDMTVYFVLQHNGRTLSNLSDYEVAAFVNNQCRGTGEITTQTGSNGTTLTYGYMRVYSNATDGETVTFKYYNSSTDEEKEVAGTSVTFVSNDAVGLPSSPFVLEAEGATTVPGDVNGDGFVDAADVSAVINHILGRSNTVFDEGAADVNGDGSIDASDVSAIINLILGKQK